MSDAACYIGQTAPLLATRSTTSGGVMSAIDREKVLARFWIKVNPCGPVHPVLGTACWLWKAGRHRGGYGEFWAGEYTVYAHRFAYESSVGPIPDGLKVDHLCRVRACVNPSHLEPVTNRENTLRGDTIPAACARKTHCPKGHAYSGDNLYVSPSRGDRECVSCQRAKQRERTIRARAARTIGAK